MVEVLKKVCTRCKRYLPLDKFPKHQGYKYGVYSRCRECVNEQSREYYEKHRDYLQAYNRQYRADITNYDIFKAEELLGGWRIYILNHFKQGESKYTAVKVATANVFRTNDKAEFLKYLEGEI